LPPGRLPPKTTYDDNHNHQPSIHLAFSAHFNILSVRNYEGLWVLKIFPYQI
jgi:hypothetical protein